ncbi:DUF4190 domain-containing protein [Actinoplanes sp. NPDC051470]|uniref:DUF4190 domain-containing protein n=1 Tax=unclassified Actinoplanes TaxID=2626549 RepID=UPI003443AA96
MTYPPPPPSSDGQYPPPDPVQPYQPPQPYSPETPAAYPQLPYATPEQQSPYGTPNQAAYPQLPYATPEQQSPYGAAYQPPPYTPYASPQPYDYGYGSPYSQGYGPALKPPAEGLAIASLVISCIAVAAVCASGVGGFLGVVGAIMGHVAQRRIRTNGLSGNGMALAGVIIGWVATALALATVALIIFAIVSDTGSTSPYDDF